MSVNSEDATTLDVQTGDAPAVNGDGAALNGGLENGGVEKGGETEAVNGKREGEEMEEGRETKKVKKTEEKENEVEESKEKENGVKEKESGSEEEKENGVEEKEKENGLEEEKGKENGVEEKENEGDALEKARQEMKEREAPSNVRKSVAEKCPECEYKGWTDAELKVHRATSHGAAPRRMRMCANCNFTCTNTWEMDYHARSKGHKAKEVITCKKCDYLCETKQEAWEHKKVHIPADKLFECGDCHWSGDRLDNMRYHAHSQDHKTKIDYEVIARAKAEARGPKDLKQYQTKLAKDIKKALSSKK